MNKVHAGTNAFGNGGGTADQTYTVVAGYNVAGSTSVALNANGSASSITFSGNVANVGTTYTQSGDLGTVSFTGATGESDDDVVDAEIVDETTEGDAPEEESK